MREIAKRGNYKIEVRENATQNCQERVLKKKVKSDGQKRLLGIRKI